MIWPFHFIMWMVSTSFWSIALPTDCSARLRWMPRKPCDAPMEQPDEVTGDGIAMRLRMKSKISWCRTPIVWFSNAQPLCFSEVHFFMIFMKPKWFLPKSFCFAHDFPMSCWCVRRLWSGSSGPASSSGVSLLWTGHLDDAVEMARGTSLGMWISSLGSFQPARNEVLTSKIWLAQCGLNQQQNVLVLSPTRTGMKWLVLFFPTCQVRVVRLYHSCSPPPPPPPSPSPPSPPASPPASPPPPLHPLPCSLPPCQLFAKLFANFRTQWALLDLNCKGLSALCTAGPQPGTVRAHWPPLDLNLGPSELRDLNLGPSELSEHRWTSTAR